jgi:ubiquitin-like 1-activating enzyme E1 A
LYIYKFIFRQTDKQLWKSKKKFLNKIICFYRSGIEDQKISSEQTMNEDQYELYDRNIRLWGKDNQTKLNNSKVLLINLNCAITELGKNLILSGISLYLFDNNKTISQEDVNSNFFLNVNDCDKDRAIVICERLSGLNSYISVKVIDNIDNFSDYNCVCLGFSSFKNMKSYEENFNKKHIVFYCINTSGMYAFFYNNLHVQKQSENISLSNK